MFAFFVVALIVILTYIKLRAPKAKKIKSIIYNIVPNKNAIRNINVVITKKLASITIFSVLPDYVVGKNNKGLMSIKKELQKYIGKISFELCIVEVDRLSDPKFIKKDFVTHLNMGVKNFYHTLQPGNGVKITILYKNSVSMLEKEVIVDNNAKLKTTIEDLILEIKVCNPRAP